MTDPKDKKVPRVIQDASDAVARDIKPALKLMGRIFFNTWLGDQSFVVDAAKEVGKRRKPAPRQSAPEPERNVNHGPEIIDAEIIEEKTCFTCGGTGKLGRPGHEVRCPKCRG
ncbi:MAG TPA: hypothetical protein VFA98_14470 [Thermoanaerobaculia bacterium]|nr:hypothetical protein [Thermoanaerobaculia bacterium]